MKTTFDLPDDLLIEAKAVAARRRTTLKEMVTRSLRREIGLYEPESQSPGSPFEAGPLGILRLKKSPNPDQSLYKILAEGDVEEVVSYLDGLDKKDT